MKITLPPAVAVSAAALLAVSLAGNGLAFWHRLSAVRALPVSSTGVSSGTLPTSKQPQISFASYRNAIVVQLPAAMPLAQLEKNIQISPTLPFTVRSDWYDDRYFIEADWTPESFYQVKLVFPAEADGTQPPPLELSFITSESDPLIATATEGIFFPLKGKLWELPLCIRNVDKITATLDQLYPNNLGEWRFNNDKTRRVSEKSFPVKPQRNMKEYWTLPLESLLPERKPGLYALSLNSAEGDCYSRQLLIITDLGVQATISGGKVLAAVRRLSDGKPVADAELNLISRKNQPLAQGYTDAKGQATLEFSLADDPEDEPRLLLVAHGEDHAYLDCFERGSQLNLNQFATDGTAEPAPEQPVRALLHPERGIMRPGETMHLFLQLRDKDSLTLPEPQPVEVVVRDADYRVVQRTIANTDAYGMASVEFPLPAEAATGYYEATAGLPGASDRSERWDSCSFLVSQFAPDQFKVTLQALPAEAVCDEPLQLAGAARYYFDEPLRDRELTVSVVSAYEPFAPAAYADYQFYPGEASDSETKRAFNTSTDPEGKFELTVPLPDTADEEKLPNMPLQLRVFASLSGANGRNVTATANAIRHRNPWYLGVRQLEDRAAFEWVAVKPDGSAAAVTAPLHFELLERRWNYATQEINQSLKRVWNEELLPVTQGEVPAAALERGSFEAAIANPGSYRLRLSDPSTGVATELDFYYWFGDGGAIRSANPSVLTFSTDHDKYLPGSVAQVKFMLPAPGLILAATGSSEAEQQQTFEGKAGENIISIPIPEEFTGGSWYAGITVLTHDATREREPQRMFGLARLNVDQSRHRLAVTLDTPEHSRPNQTETIRIALHDGAGQPVAGQVQLWAVDTGVLALMNWEAPDTFARFYGARRNALRFFDTYSQLYPALRILPDGQIGGDGMALRLRNNFAPDIEHSAVKVLAPVQTDANGNAEVSITWPDHAGSMRLMATASSAQGVGSHSREITLRHPATVRITPPTVVAPGDEFEVTLEIFNHDFETLNATWQWKSVGDITPLDEVNGGEVSMTKGAQQLFKRRYRAGNTPGAAGVVAQLTHSDNSQQWDDRAGFSIRPASSFQSRIENHLVAPGETITLAGDESRWFAGTLKRQLEVGGSPAARLTGTLTWLNAYPYGCAEQTAAAAFPLLGVPSLVRAALVPEHFLGQRDRTVNTAMQRLQNMQCGYGSFSMWPGSSEAWLDGSLFVAHFLLEAEANGYTIDTELRQRMLYQLARQAQAKENSPMQRAYANYLCALGGKAARGIAEELLATPHGDDLAGFLAAAALMKSGEAKTGAERLSQYLEQKAWRAQPEYNVWYQPAMRLGMMLWITMDLLPEHPATHAMAQELAAMLTPDRFSTQENAWAALGLGRWAATYGAQPGSGKLTLADGTVREFSGVQPFHAELPNAPVQLTNTGSGPLYVQCTLAGIPVRAEACSDGITVTRSYLNEAGEAVTEAKVGELLTVAITLLSAAPVDNIVLTDLLPGGVAIEDERLATRYAPLSVNRNLRDVVLHPRFLEKGDDRLLLFGDIVDSQLATFTYRVRAITPGQYQLPPVAVEAMYEPQTRGCAVYDGQSLTIR